MGSQLRVTFEPTGRTVHVLPGTTVLEAAARAGLTIDTPCGGAGTCGKCRVRFTQGADEPCAPAERTLTADELDAGWRLACQARLSHDATIELPESSLFAGGHQILTDTAGPSDQPVQPAIRKEYVELTPPTLDDPAADLLRLQQAVGPVRTDLEVLRRLSGVMRESHYAGTAVIANNRLVDFQPGDTTGTCLGLAVDIGTTTIVGSLLELTTGREVSLSAMMNPQVRHGDDVLSRIKHGQDNPAGLDDLRGAVLEAINAILDDVTAKAGVSRRDICEIALAGNTTMQHLLCGLDVTQLGQVPFVPTFARGLVLRAADLDVSIHPGGLAYVFPVIGGFVGGDIVAGLLATRLDGTGEPTLLVDIGTNGEIVLSAGGRLLAASTAAGPAFEGARISCGMRATRGAIEKVVFDGDVRMSTISDAPPVGLCGSALVDLAAELLRVGIVTCEGRLLAGDELPADLPDPLRRRVTAEAGPPRFVLAGADGDRGEVALTQRDIRELQLAAGALRAGLIILLQRAGLTPADVQRVHLAGGFGSFIRRSHAQRIGLLPREIPHHRISYVGNAALNGARWALLSTAVRQQAEQLARSAEHVELAQDPNFQMLFAEAMIFPEDADE